jgi:hypothetical protein
LFWVVVVAAWSSCYRGNEYTVTENEPELEPDTTIITYYGNLSLGTIKLPADTIYSTFQENPANPDVSYSMESYVDQILTFSLFWSPISPNEEKITEGTYPGCCSILMDDSSLTTIQDWILRGRDQPLILDSVMFHYYVANNVDINVSNVVEAVKTDTLAPGVVWITDRATVEINGIMVNVANGQPKAISGSFACYFGRMGM